MRYQALLLTLALLSITAMAFRKPANPSVTIYFIRHGEKPAKGDNLDCQGENRALQLPGVIKKKIGIPNFTFIPSVGNGTSTTQSRMFQTITPTAVKYGLTLNSSHHEKDSLQMAADLKSRKGTVLVVWDHQSIAAIVRALGVPNFDKKWHGDDFDSIWIVTITNGTATYSKDKEDIKPSSNCSF
ncbi:histidine phosphatase family protein [Mucilaginibacter sp. PPCGB 2223]|uniref:histidine phosphatase family protein n=1 Tax=Mucilaginibacter sp. PPCGB 2223 TaxID=1886027 RepID=UPI0008265509|nr:histidine phosphatase family protein [Mucilaginibacter sp. PPCGB 2223]OCX51805.1 histidine phosphatase family protein [Mucilaginibacter sp. PPCGB 2223]